jgi:uncharacterized protein (TIGR03382 family)
MRLLGFALALLVPTAALACSCPVPGADGFTVAPVDGATGVPTNTRVWVVSAVPGTLVLEGGGERVGGRITHVGGVATVLTPERELQQRTSYVLIGVDARGDTPLDTTFTTGDGPDADPPEVDASPGRVIAEDEGPCGPVYLAGFTVRTQGALLAVADVGGGATLDPAGPSGTVSGSLSPLQQHAELEPERSVDLGSTLCGQSWPGAAPGASTTVRFGAFDLAGNFSGWSPALTAKFPEASGCSAGGVPGWPALLALLALTRLRTCRNRA